MTTPTVGGRSDIALVLVLVMMLLWLSITGRLQSLVNITKDAATNPVLSDPNPYAGTTQSNTSLDPYIGQSYAGQTPILPDVGSNSNPSNGEIAPYNPFSGNFNVQPTSGAGANLGP